MLSNKCLKEEERGEVLSPSLPQSLSVTYVSRVKVRRNDKSFIAYDRY